ncbi:MAG: PIG-L deacetylase family protein [Pseudonocardiaceae bacterium]
MAAPPTVLVIAPHPDDEVLGCGGSILLHTAAGRVVHVLYLTSGERGNPHHTAEELRRVREAEATAAARVLGIPVSRLHFARFPDGGILPTALDQVAVVMRLLRKVRPGLVYLPHAEDASFDHRAGFELAWRAFGMAGSRNFPEWGTEPHWVPTVLGYEVWAAIGQPVYFEDITAVLDRKLTALACYGSQTAGAKGVGQAGHVGPAAAHLTGWRGASTTGGHREAFTVPRLGQVIL